MKIKVKKDETVEEFLTLMNNLQPWLAMSKIPENHISSYTNEPWTYNNLRKLIKWIHDFLLPPIKELQSFYAQYDRKVWQNIKILNPRHDVFQGLDIYGRKVRDVWFKRPRFPKDRGRVQEEGY